MNDLSTLIDVVKFIPSRSDGDGKQELAVAYVDRVVRVYRYTQVTLSNENEGIESTSSQLTLIHKWTLEGQVK